MMVEQDGAHRWHGKPQEQRKRWHLRDAQQIQQARQNDGGRMAWDKRQQ